MSFVTISSYYESLEIEEIISVLIFKFLVDIARHFRAGKLLGCVGFDTRVL